MPARWGKFGTALLLAATAGSPAQDSPRRAHLELIGDKAFVNVTINGQGPFRFVVDTGTSAEAVITPELSTRLHLPVASHAILRAPGRSAQARVPVHLLQSLRVADADVAFILVPAVEHSLGALDSTCQGLIGFPLFRDYLLTLDYPNQRLTLATDALQPDGERRVLPMRQPEGVPVVLLRAGPADRPLEIGAQIDSGGGGLSLPAAFAARLRFASPSVTQANAQSLTGRIPVDAVELADDVHLGVYTFKRPFIEMYTGFPLANFGATPMRNFAITFDQRNSLVRFDAQLKTFRPTATLNTSGPQFGAGEWQTPGLTLRYSQPD
jgi:hypothetical protein